MPVMADHEPLRLSERAAPDATVVGRLSMTFEARTRSRCSGFLDDGREVTIVLPRGDITRGGDKLATSDGVVVEVVAAAEPLLEVLVTDAQMLARAAYHLGNRHVAVEVRAQGLRVAEDAVLERMLRGLGLTPTRTEAPFEPEGGAYGDRHAHGHGGDAHRLAPIIHEYRRS